VTSYEQDQRTNGKGPIEILHVSCSRCNTEESIISRHGDGTIYMKQVTPKQIEQCKMERAKEINPITKRTIRPATVNRELACLKHIYTLAIEWGDVEKNPVKGVKFLQEKNLSYRYLTQDEIQKLLATASGTLRSIILTALSTGMRLNEILTLRWEHVDLGKRMITVEDSKNKDFRRIAMNPTLTKELSTIKMNGEFVSITRHNAPVAQLDRATDF